MRKTRMPPASTQLPNHNTPQSVLIPPPSGSVSRSASTGGSSPQASSNIFKVRDSPRASDGKSNRPIASLPSRQTRTTSTLPLPNASLRDALHEDHMLQKFLEICKWNPEVYVLADESNDSSTRDFKFYDEHLHPKLQLQEVVVIPQLPEILMRRLDEEILQRDRTPVCPKDFPPPEHWPMETELDVQKTYAAETGSFATTVAADILFDTNNAEYDARGGLAFVETQMSKKEGMADAHVIVQKSSSTAPCFRKDAALLERLGLSKIVTLEFKKLSFGGVLHAIEGMEGKFEWRVCSSEAFCKAKSKHFGPGKQLAITGEKIGPDPGLMEATERDDPDEDVHIGKKRAVNATVEIQAQRPTCLGELVAIAEEKLKSSTINSGTADKAADPQRAKVKRLLQQVWASMVKDDTTFSIINAGNFEMIGVRYRSRQTLYISPVIDVTTFPFYGKLAIAVPVAAYRETILRGQELYSMYRGQEQNVDPLFWAERKTQFLSDLESVQRISVGLNMKFAGSNEPLIFDRILESRSGEDLTDAPPPGLVLSLDPTQKQELRALIFVVSRPDGETYQENVVLKLVRFSDQAEELQREYRRYEEVKAAGFPHIPKVFGLFKSTLTVSDEEYWAILMSHAGKPLSDMRLIAHRNKYQRVVEDTLEELHHCNFEHGRICMNHILIQESPPIARFICFTAARKSKVVESEASGDWKVMRRIFPKRQKRDVEAV